MFTDWTLTDPMYFYQRGIILGVIIAWVIIPSLIFGLAGVRECIKRKKEI